MATCQVEKLQLTQEEKTNLDEICRRGDCTCASGDIMQEAAPKVAKNECMDVETVRNRLTVVVGVLKNQTQGNLNVLDSKKWGGHVVKNYPNPLKIGMGIFGQGGLSYKGVEAAVVYSGKNRAGVECFWLLAWADTKGLGHRIYAECGRRENFIRLDWDKVKTQLENGEAVIKVRDPETATAIYAGIVGYKDKDVVGAALCG